MPQWTWGSPWCVTTTRQLWAGSLVLVQFPTKWQHSAETATSDSVPRTTQVVACPTWSAPRPTWSPSAPTPQTARVSTVPHTTTSQVRLTKIIHYGINYNIAVFNFICFNSDRCLGVKAPKEKLEPSMCVDALLANSQSVIWSVSLCELCLISPSFSPLSHRPLPSHQRLCVPTMCW